MAGINWDIKDFMADMKAQGGAAAFPVLMALWARTNRRSRCYPSISTICNDTGYSREPVVSAVKWLGQVGAFVKVPHDKRFGKEMELPNRQSVYELTGVVIIDGQSHQYLYLNIPKSSANELSKEGHSSASESSPAEPKGSYSSKGSKNKGKVADAPSSPSQLRGAVLESLRSNKVGMSVAILANYKRALFKRSSEDDFDKAGIAWHAAGKTKAAAVEVVDALGKVYQQSREPYNCWTWAMKELTRIHARAADVASRTIAREDS